MTNTENSTPGTIITTNTDGTVRLTPAQARWVAETIAWNVDLETVRLDNGDAERADFLAAFADAILGKPRG